MPADVVEVRVDEAGWPARGPKRAIVLADHATRFEVRDGDRVIDRGDTVPLGRSVASGDATSFADLSVRTPGRYRLVLPDLGVDAPFVVADRPYWRLAEDALQFFFSWRLNVDTGQQGCRFSPSGCEQTHGPGLPADAHAESEHGPMDVTGGWADAGDFGKYVPSGAVSAVTLLMVAERFPRWFADGDGSHPIPESGNGVPDILDEVAFELDFLLKLQDPDGAVHHKVHGVEWPQGGLDPSQVTGVRRVQPVSTEAARELAGVAARASRVFQKVDPARSARYLDAARRAWTWSEANPSRFYYRNVPDDIGGGDYPIDDLPARDPVTFGVDERYWAAAELYCTTGEAPYRDAVRASPIAYGTTTPQWGDVDFFGTEALAGCDRPESAAAKRAIEAAADGRVAAAARNPWLLARPDDAPLRWGSNGDLANDALVVASAARDRRRTELVASALDHLLGVNPLGRSYVTGYGPADRRPLHPTSHWFQHVGHPLPGLLVGGPNSVLVDDPLTPRTGPPARRYADYERAWASNEIAINWNAPLVFLAVWLDEATR